MITDLMQFTLFVLILPLPFGDVRYAPITGEDQGRVIDGFTWPLQSPGTA
jgi:hypothetical protein